MAITHHTNARPGARIVYIGLGANLGDAQATLAQALAELAGAPGVLSCVASPFYLSDPVDAQGPEFVNAVAVITTLLEPLAVLDQLQAIEQAHYRRRPYRNAPRTLDLDLLWYEGVEMDSERLILPHPRMHERAFVLLPLRDLAPDMVLQQGHLGALIDACSEQVIRRKP